MSGPRHIVHIAGSTNLQNPIKLGFQSCKGAVWRSCEHTFTKMVGHRPVSEDEPDQQVGQAADELCGVCQHPARS